jgi:hypothetical protein
MLAGAPLPKFPGNQPTKDESSLSKWNKDMIYCSRYLVDLYVPWPDESSPLYERSAEGFCLLIYAWNKKSTTFIDHQWICFLSNIMTKGHQIVIMKPLLLHDANMLIGGQKKIMAPITQHTLQPQMVE